MPCITVTKQDLIELGCDPDHVSDWFKIRKDKRAPSLTGTAWNAITKQIELAGITIPEAIEACCEFEWRGFRAEWYRNKRVAPANTFGKVMQQDSAKDRKEAVRVALRNVNDTSW